MGYSAVNEILCTNQSFVGSGGFGNAIGQSTDLIDLQAARDIAEGENCYIQVTVGTAFAIGAFTPHLIIGIGFSNVPTMIDSSTTMPFAAMRQADPVNFGQVLGYLAADLPAKREILIPVPPMTLGRQRYMGLIFLEPLAIVGFPTPGTASYFSAGTLSARLVRDPSQRIIYPTVPY